LSTVKHDDNEDAKAKYHMCSRKNAIQHTVHALLLTGT